jgi:succinate-acetate transporter protein
MAVPSERWTPAGPIRSILPPEALAQEEARAAASVADSASLGLFGFAAATFTLSAVHAGWFPTPGALVAALPLIIFGGIMQFLAGMWAFRKGDSFAATTFGSIGALYVTYGFYLVLKQAGLITGAGAIGGVMGVFLICLGLITALLMVAALWKNMALVGTLFFITIAYVLLGIGMIASGSALMMHVGGWAGLVASIFAFYAGGAMVVNSLAMRQILPLGEPLSSGPRRRPQSVADLERRARELERALEQLKADQQQPVTELERPAL